MVIRGQNQTAGSTATTTSNNTTTENSTSTPNVSSTPGAPTSNTTSSAGNNRSPGAGFNLFGAGGGSDFAQMQRQMQQQMRGNASKLYLVRFGLKPGLCKMNE